VGVKGRMLILYPKQLYMKDWDSSLLKWLLNEVVKETFHDI
jgi:hypothetical protein